MRKFEVVRDEFKKNNKNAEVILPSRSTAKSAGYDFHIVEGVLIPPHQTVMVWSDVKASMEADEVLQLYIRSSLGKKGLALTNCVGIVDSDYYSNPSNDGNIGFGIHNSSDEGYIFAAGDKIAQGIFSKYLITDDDSASGDRTGGFGSTGN